jgi:chromosome segregation ATPase
MDTEALWQAIAAYGNARWRGYSHEIDAADHLAEIKRLLDEADEEHKSLLAENERLVDEVAELKAAYESQFKELHTLKTENERLVDEVAEARKEISEQARLNGMGAEREARLMAENAELKAKLAEKDALLRRAMEALEGFVNVANDSQGVAGYHLNGDTAEWDEFDEVDAASSAIEAIGNHLGVKND